MAQLYDAIGTRLHALPPARSAHRRRHRRRARGCRERGERRGRRRRVRARRPARRGRRAVDGHDPPARSARHGRAVQAVAGDLPFRDGAFAAALAVLTMHHWPDRQRGYAELRRVARRRRGARHLGSRLGGVLARRGLLPRDDRDRPADLPLDRRAPPRVARGSRAAAPHSPRLRRRLLSARTGAGRTRTSMPASGARSRRSPSSPMSGPVWPGSSAIWPTARGERRARTSHDPDAEMDLGYLGSPSVRARRPVAYTDS